MTHYHQLFPEDIMPKEPVLTGATLLALVGSVLTLLVAFGVDLDAQQQAAVLGLATVVAPLVVAVVVRAKVSPTP